jgi:Rieske Fe-S protein
MQEHNSTRHATGTSPDGDRSCHGQQQSADQPASPCPGCMAHAGGPSLCAQSAPPAPVVRRSTFVRGLGAAAGLFAVSGAMGSIARVAAKQSPAAAAATAAPAALTGPGRFLGSVKSLALKQAATYTDPASGDPAMLVHLANGKYVAFDAVCTHAGCTVQFDAKRQLIVCPCHGATYDPAQAAKVLGGPTNTPLAPLAVRVDANQNVYALDAKANGSQANQLKQSTAYTGQTGDDGGGNGTRGGSDDGGSGDDGGRVLRPSGTKLSASTSTHRASSGVPKKAPTRRRTVRRVSDD